MARVIMISRNFLSKHPRKGEPTYFVEKIWNSIYKDKTGDWSDAPGPIDKYVVELDAAIKECKHHTIRAGHRFKAGDWVSLRVWSGKPYRSKQIIIAPDIQIKKVWNFVIDCDYFLNNEVVNIARLKTIAKNDGFTTDGITDLDDFELWFANKNNDAFDGQIICWNENINY